MGQRTQILVIKEKNNGEKKNYFFHHQWGFGRVMYLGLMDLFLQDYFKDTFKKDYNFLDCGFSASGQFYDISNSIPEEVLGNVNIDDFDTIKKVFEYGDNNNGGMVVRIKESGTVYGGAQFEVGFLLGKEDTSEEWKGEKYNEGNDTEAFARWLTPEEYGAMNGGSRYSDKKFVKICTDFFKYFNIKTVKNKKKRGKQTKI